MQEHCSRLCHTVRMGTRQDSRERIEARIIELGRAQLVTEGAAALSLRAIAREMGMVSSAVYRYVASRDELLTLLLVDAYTDLADTVDSARAGAAGRWRREIVEMACAARQWALPGYQAPAEKTVGPGTRVVGALFGAVAAGIAAGDIADDTTPVATELSRDFERLREEFGFAGGDRAVARCFTLWAGLVGAISLEVFGQYGADTLTAPAAVFDLQIELLLDLMTKK